MTALHLAALTITAVVVGLAVTGLAFVAREYWRWLRRQRRPDLAAGRTVADDRAALAQTARAHAARYSVTRRGVRARSSRGHGKRFRYAARRDDHRLLRGF